MFSLSNQSPFHKQDHSVHQDLFIYLFSEDTSCLFLSSPLWFPVGSDWKRMQFSLDLNGRKKKVGGHGDKTTKEGRKALRGSEEVTARSHGQKIPRPLGPPPPSFSVLSKSIGDRAKTPSVAVGRCKDRCC